MNGPRASWQMLSAAPHRLFFWTGASYAVVAMAVWTLQQVSLYTGWPTPYAWSVPYAQAHGFMMIYGLFGFYFFGFLLTTFPRWLDAEPVPRRAYVAGWLFIFLGAHLFWVGLYVARELSLVACALMWVGYLVATAQCVRVLYRTRSPQRIQQIFMTAGLSAGMVGIAVTAWAIAAPHPATFRLARVIGLYLFLLPVIFSVAYRMVPFFGSVVTPGAEIRRSPHALHWFTAFLVLRAVLTQWELVGWFWLADAGLFFVLARELVQWRFWRAPALPLLTILYVGLGWFLVSFALSSAESLLALANGLDQQPFRQAALHALTVGGFGSLLIGLSTRVTLGHSGGGLTTTRFIAGLFYGYQIVPLMRVVPDVLSYFMPRFAAQGFWAGIPWMVVFALWLLLIGPVLTRPRVDGRPG